MPHPSSRLLWLLLLLIAPPSTSEAVLLRIQSESRLQLELEETGRRPRIEGRLLDNVNQGIANQAVTLEFYNTVRGRVQLVEEANTDHLGYFTLTPTLRDGSYELRASFAGTTHYESAEADAPLEVRRAPLDIEQSIPRLVHADNPRVPVPVEIKAALPYDVPAVLKFDLEIGEEAPFRDTIRLSAPDYQARLNVGLNQLEGSGRLPATLHFAGDDYFPGATFNQDIFIFHAPVLTFKATTVRERASRGLQVSGALRSQEGPVPRGLIRTEAALVDSAYWQRIGDTETAEDGRFSVFFNEDALPVGEIQLRVSFIPDAGEAITSDPVRLKIERSGAGTWAMILLTGFLVLGLLVVIAYFVWERIKAALAARKRRRKRSDREAVARPQALPDPPPELPASRDAIAGVVFDPHDSRAVADVELFVMPAGGASEVIAQGVSDARGRFAFTELPSGNHRLVAVAHGFVTGTMALSIPHRGEHRFFRYDLVSVRVRVRELYSWLLGRYAPDEELWGLETPRETRRELYEQVESFTAALPDEPRVGHHTPITPERFDAIRRVLREPDHTLGELIDALTVLLEEVYYSPRLHDESILTLADALVTRLEEPLERLGREQRLGKRRQRRAGGQPSHALRPLA